ncbi:PTS system mannose/fructose/sorbose family transporter subunit IID [Ligilactobacillus pobuzihii]|uniref:PTS system, mannose fructose sorbose family IID component n=1 Tax=Ligilactobacillus pobuzihii TaxID=449659 RepID=A0A0R2LHK7_9LACO|nr:PTS system mannose/fructose/sorbose family transporter subunit IID [Ligilactobacillus pobuzihii]KRK09478.1 PTS system, mannose fructose sorbose family IID component [Ligilactobacillus pobuzihii E100301 = KCTC 13174]KRO01284.1 PTS system, mannose fructose sorbose family IID component [Ligilactobacillus pobuzihii]GEN48870.1 PTS mannose transporter subunit IID [Ligilactobacillus pobuzihii]
MAKGKLTKKDLNKVFWRSFALQGSESYTDMQGMGYTFSILPALKKIYSDDEDQLYESALRNTALFNTTPHIATFIMGMSLALEEENSEDPAFDTEAISSLKAALMGPVAGIGDTLYWGTFRVIAAGIGLSLAVQGNILGPVLYFLFYTTLHVLGRYGGVHLGYSAGTKAMEKAFEGNYLEKFTEAASIVGLMSIGAMTSSLVTFKISAVFKTAGGTINVQNILNDIFPGLLPLGLTFLIYYLLNRKVKVIYLILGIFVLAIAGVYLGILK